jgi:hypothetical protein
MMNRTSKTARVTEEVPMPPPPTPQQYKCSANPSHQWTTLLTPDITLDLGAAGKIEHLCPHCLYFKLKNLLQNVGRVEIVNDGSD